MCEYVYVCALFSVSFIAIIPYYCFHLGPIFQLNKPKKIYIKMREKNSRLDHHQTIANHSCIQYTIFLLNPISA